MVVRMVVAVGTNNAIGSNHIGESQNGHKHKI
jgi:hypothetical protein